MSYVPASSTISTSNLVSRNSSGNFISNNITPGYTATATAAGTTTLTVNSTQQQFFTGATTQTVVLPVVSTLTLGMQFRIVNVSSGQVTVQSSGLNTLQVMDASSLLIATVISLSGTGTASWNWVYQEEAPATGASPGSLQYFATDGGTSISGWLPCDGSIVSQATYPDLFAQMGLINGPNTIWTSTDLDTQMTITALSHANSTYFAFGPANYPYKLWSSTDAATWTPRSVPSTATQNAAFTGVAFGESLYVFGNQGGFVTSTDLVTFTTTTIPGYGSGSATAGVAYGNGMFVSGGANGLLFTSTDGLTWAFVPTPNSSNGTIQSVKFINSIFVLVGSAGTLVTSTDGIKFDTLHPGIGSTTAGSSLAFGDKFIAVNTNGSVVSSTDFVTWTSRNSQTTSSLIATLFANSTYLYCGSGGALGTSTDGITWTSATSGTSSAITALTFGTLYVYAGLGGVLRSSTDAVTWDSRTSGTASNIFGLTFGNSLYVYCGAGGVLRSSTDAITWDSRTSGSTSILYGLAYNSGLGLYAYCGDNGALATSTDAITWNARTSNTSTLWSITSNGTIFAAAGNVGAIITSTDGVSWPTSYCPSTDNLGSIYYNGTNFYACGQGNNSPLLTSTDAITWNFTQGFEERYGTFNDVAFGNSIYVIGTAFGDVYSSTDLITLTKRSTPETATNTYVVFGNGEFAIGAAFSGGVGGGISTSTDGISWYQASTFGFPSRPLTGMAAGAQIIASLGPPFSTIQGTPYNQTIVRANLTYSYATDTQFQLPDDAQEFAKNITPPRLTVESIGNFQRGLYIKT